MCCCGDVLNRLGGQLELLSFQNFRYVQIEEVAIQNGLNNTSDDGNKVIMTFRHVSIDPIKNVKSPVGAQCEQVVTRNAFSLTGLADKKQLWEDCNRLQVDRERP